MFCRSCGKEISPQAEFCTGCGVKPGTGKSFCYSCGATTSDLAEICVKCGVRLNNAQTAAPMAGAAPVYAAGGVSPKSKMLVFLMSLFFGQLGIHRFIAGKVGTGVVFIILTVIGYATMVFVVGFAFLAAVWIWNLVDLIMILVNKFKDKNGLLITKW